jgi:5-methylcytosine-specific restriction endonuclease McrA
MSVFAQKRCLVLNKAWAPVGTVSLQRAIIMLFSQYGNGEPKARVIDPEGFQTFTWDDWAKLQPLVTDDVIRGSNMVFKVPEIILLTRYERLPQPKVHFSRRTLYKRDNMKCQYCNKRPGSSELTIDHITPKSRGGGTTWENCVLACVECNARKADRQPHECGMKLLTEPKKPRVHLFRHDTIKPVLSWQAFLGEMYWNIGIGDDE